MAVAQAVAEMVITAVLAAAKAEQAPALQMKPAFCPPIHELRLT